MNELNHVRNGETLLRMESITKMFPGVRALASVDFSCSKGEIHALLGENGAGKSTLIKILGGVYQPDEGSMYLDDDTSSVVCRSPFAAQKLGISIVHQEFNLIPYMTVAENIFLGQEDCNKLKCIRAACMKDEAQVILKRLGSEMSPTDLVVTLDSTNQKMVQIAKAIVTKPKILVVDEPTASLGTHEIEQFFNVLRDLKEQGTTVIYISHLLEEVFEIADRMTILKDGKLVRVRNVSETSMEEVIRDMIGRELGELFPEKSGNVHREVSESLFSVTDLNLGRALRNVNFSLSSGEILGVAGLEGNGQNELLKTVFGIFGKDSGTIKVKGKAVTVRTPQDAIRCGFSLVSDKRKVEGICPDLSVHQNLMLPTLKKRQTFGFIDRQSERELVDRNVKEYRIKTSDNRKAVRFLSGGNQQKVILGKWLNSNPDIVFLMEPTQGVDVGAKAEIYQLIRNLADREQKGIVMVSGDMLELLGLCDRVIVMHTGEIVKELKGSSITEENILRAAVGVSDDPVLLQEENSTERVGASHE